MNRLFTLIELIVVIVVLGILASFIIPNISNVKDDAIATASNVERKHVQTAVDHYTLNHNGEFPVRERPTVSKPQILDINELVPEHLRNDTQNKEANYWVDHAGQVWSAVVDAPEDVSYDSVTGRVTWDKVDNAIGYNVYEEKTAEGTASKGLAFVKFVDVNYYDGKPNKKYLISAVDRFRNETAPVGDDYIGEYKVLSKPSIKFDGKSSIIVENNGALTLPNTLTVEAWVKPEKNTRLTIVYKNVLGLGTENKDNYSLYWDNDRFVFQIERASDSDDFYARSRTGLPSNQWYHIAVSYDENSLKMYINGVLEVDRVTGKIEQYHGPGVMQIGSNDISNHGLINYFNGEISEVRIWNIARSGEEIYQNFNKDLTGNEHGLVGLWEFKEGEGQFVHDKTNNNNRGEFQGDLKWIVR